MVENKRKTGVAVIGLGRFGSSLALKLADRDIDVLGVDRDPRTVQSLTGRLPHVVAADSTDLEAMRLLGVPEFSCAVVGIGTDVEASILTTSLLIDLEIEDIWAKAANRDHGRILRRIGAHHVVSPEHDMGKRVAHLVAGRTLDFVEVEDDFAIVKTAAPTWAVGRPLGKSEIRATYGVTVVSVKRRGQDFTHTTAETTIMPGDTLIVAGPTHQVEQFADLT